MSQELSYLQNLLKLMVSRGASDLHLKAMRPPLLRIDGELLPVKTDPLSSELVAQIAHHMINSVQRENLERDLAIDLGYSAPGLARFRVNIYYQRGTVAIALRRIAFAIPTIRNLQLPPVLRHFTQRRHGLVLVTGPTGTGKSTTLAALLQEVNQQRRAHVITIEDPIEYLFRDELASIDQREIGTDCHNFAAALRNALREDPDVVMVGEMRDLETIRTVMTAAETGHLIFSTLHTNSAAQTLTRVIDVFPVEQQSQIRLQLSHVLVGVVSQRLINRRDIRGRIAAVEVLLNSPRIQRLLAEGRIDDIQREMENSVDYYRMQTMDQSIIALMANGVVDREEALKTSRSPEDLLFNLRKLGFDGDVTPQEDLARAG